MTRPMRRPACSRAQGIERREVPIIVFQMAKLRMKIDYKDDDEDDDDNDDDGDDDDDDDGDGVDDEDDGDDDDDNGNDDDGDDGHMVTMLLCLPAAGETPRN